MTEYRDATHGESIRSQRVPCQKCFLLQDKTERSQKVCNATRPAPKSMLRKYAGSGRSLRGAKSWLSWGHQRRVATVVRRSWRLGDSVTRGGADLQHWCWT